MKPKQATRAHANANEQAAKIISQDVMRYPAGSLAQRWAFIVLAKMAPTVRGPLFAREVGK